MAVKHAFTSAKADGGDVSVVRPSNWNADHLGGVSVLNRDLVQVDVVNTAVETSIFSFSIPANAMGTVGGVELEVGGDYLNNSGAQRTVIVKVKLGATTILNTGALGVDANANRRRFFLRVLLMNSAANAQKVMALLEISGISSTTFAMWGTDQASPQASILGAGVGSAAEDTTLAKTLDVTVQHSVANASLSLRKELALLKLIPND